MQIPLEVNYRNVRKTEALDAQLRRLADKLHRFAGDIVRCRIALEEPQRHQRSGNPYRVRIEVTLPPEHDLIVVKTSRDDDPNPGLQTLIAAAFEAMERRVKDTAARRRGAVKPREEPAALVTRLFPEEGYGFLITADGREIYFHRNSVLDDGFDRLAPGTGVRYAEEMGEEGPQASSVRIVDRPGRVEPEPASREATRPTPPRERRTTVPLPALKELLDKEHVKYVTLSHSPAYTAQEIAASAHVPGKELAKTVMVKVDDELAMAVLPASRHIELNRLQEALGASKVELAQESEFKGRFPDCEVGAMPPFGKLFGMKTFEDQALAEDEEIAFNAGTHTELMRMAFTDYERLAEPVRLRFAEKN